MMDSLHYFIYILCVLLSLVHVCISEYLIQSFTGKIGSGNYSYHKLTAEGNIRLLLESTVGDADLYLSESTLKPDFDNYDLCSVTCGDDEVLIEVCIYISQKTGTHFIRTSL